MEVSKKTGNVIGNGSLILPLAFGRVFRVFGGPVRNAPEGLVVLKMAAEISVPCDINVPTVDFSVPSKATLDAGLEAAVDAVLKRNPLYVGCMAGRGRTGLFLAVLAKAFGIESPVEYVRENYYRHAVETDGQYKFVEAYEIPLSVRKKIAVARMWAWVHVLMFSPKDLTKI